METLEKMKQPKTVEHKRKDFTKCMKTRWEKLREKEYGFTR